MTQGLKRINPPGMKFCVRCQRARKLELFHLAKRSHDGRFTYCKECTKQRNSARTPELRHRWHVRQRYDLSAEQYAALLQQQEGVCAVCKAVPKKRHLAVDHDHKTGKIRGLLCFRCNTALGQLEEKFELFSALAQYLACHAPAEGGS